MKLLLIGSGNRAQAYAMYFKNEIYCVCDLYKEKSEMLIKDFNLTNAVALNDYKKCSGYDGIIIAVPDFKHDEVFSWAVKQDAHLLLEKPVSTSEKSLRNMYECSTGFKKSIILGFTLRYTFMYKKILELIEDGSIGNIITVEATETLDPLHAARFFRRWHRFSVNSGGLLNTKCSHDMDMINQVVPGNPKFISSFGSNSIFKPGRGADFCSAECQEYGSCRYIDKNVYKYSTADTTLCPYNVDSDIVDHQVVSMEFDSGATAVFTLTMHSDKGNRYIFIHGTDGSIKAEFDDQKVILKLTGQADRIFMPDDTKGSHGGGDKVLCDFFSDCIKNGIVINQLSDGITASAMALAADKSRIDKNVIDLGALINYMHLKK